MPLLSKAEQLEEKVGDAVVLSKGIAAGMISPHPKPPKKNLTANDMLNGPGGGSNSTDDGMGENKNNPSCTTTSANKCADSKMYITTFGANI